jgi:hypothetical protein
MKIIFAVSNEMSERLTRDEAWQDKKKQTLYPPMTFVMFLSDILARWDLLCGYSRRMFRRGVVVVGRTGDGAQGVFICL